MGWLPGIIVEKVPSCRPLSPGDIVVLDNLGSHRSKAVRQLIRSAGAKLFFLPKYSPDLNPIEQVFAKLKHLLRKAAARTVDAVCAKAIGRNSLTLSRPKNKELPQKLGKNARRKVGRRAGGEADQDFHRPVRIRRIAPMPSAP